MAGCGPQKSSKYSVKIPPKWQGAPYHLAFSTKTTKPNPSGITVPDITYTANPNALENRACLVVRFHPVKTPKKKPAMDQMIMGPVSISGTKGSLPADYMDAVDKSLSNYLGAYGVKGKVKVSAKLVMSSISSQAGDSEIKQNSLSDWISTEVDFKHSR